MNLCHTVGQRSLPFIVVLALLLSVSSCKETDKRELAEQGVAQFRAQANSEQYHAIYTGADEKFRSGSNEAAFVALMQLVHRKLGTIQQSELKSYQIGWFAGEGSVVTLFYKTQFANGAAAEEFIWHLKDSQSILVGYFIKSDVLTAK